MQKILVFIAFAVLGQASANNPCEGLHLEFVNDYASCSRYFSCVNGFPHPVQCQDGRWFNLDPLGCFPATHVECEKCPSEGVVTFGIENSCTDYRLCINGTPLDRTCASGTRFDRRAGRCVLNEDAECDYLTCPDVGMKIVADPTDCSRYIVCVDGEEIPRQCMDGLLFDVSSKSCAVADSVVCPSRVSAFRSIDLVPYVPTVPVIFPTVPTARPLP